MRSADADRFVIDPSLTFLNHGSFGACPRRVLEAQSELRLAWERDPLGFYDGLHDRIDATRREIAALVGADAAGFVFVRNATMGVNAVMQSFPLRPGDEVLTTDHAYAACRNALAYWTGRAGASVITARIPFPIAHQDDAVVAIESAVTPRTRLAMIDHVTSPTGLVLPIERIVRSLEARGVSVLVDGAHAPGMVPLAIDRMAPSFYTGNFHKWLCAPKGSAMLWVRADHRAAMHPTSISHGFTARTPRSALHDEFDWTGTDDPSPWLVLPECVRVLIEMAGSLDRLMEDNRVLALEARRILTTKLGVAPAAPESMIGTLVAVPLRARSDDRDGVDPLYAALFERRFRVPIMPWPGPRDRILRVSAQRYNDASQYEALADAVVELRDVL
jgi:isopenicillin-N epimerase